MRVLATICQRTLIAFPCGKLGDEISQVNERPPWEGSMNQLYLKIINRLYLLVGVTSSQENHPVRPHYNKLLCFHCGGDESKLQNCS